MSKPHRFQFFRRALREMQAARAIADPAIVRAHRRLAALYLERGARIGRSARHAKAPPAGGPQDGEVRS